MFFVLLYLSFGLILAAGTMLFPILRSHMDVVTRRNGLSPGYARLLWMIGTSLAWPVSLYVFLSGKLLWANSDHQDIIGPSSAQPAPPIPTTTEMLGRSTLDHGDIACGPQPIRRIESGIGSKSALTVCSARFESARSMHRDDCIPSG